MIIRGTTPTLKFGLPFETNMIAVGFVTVRQNESTIFEKPLSACQCDGCTLTAKLTQEETLKLESELNAEIRLVVKTAGGDRLESYPVCVGVSDTSKEGVI